MKVMFNLVRCGLANNGGSQSIIRMALALRKHCDVSIISDKPNRFTWFDFPTDILHFINVDCKDWPKADTIIATGCGTVMDTVNYPHASLDNKFYWIRGFEKWAKPEKDLYEGYMSGLRLIVNSEWQKLNIFEKCGIVSDIIYPGIPIDDFAAQKIIYPDRNVYAKPVIGALYQIGKETKKFAHVLEVCRALNHLELLEALFLFGDTDLDGKVRDFLVSENITYKYLKQPSFIDKIDMMRNCDIWLATTINDGLHIPPMEAGMCGCNLVAAGHRASGMSDYAIEDMTAKTFLTAKEACKRVMEYIDYPVQQIEHSLNLVSVLKKKINSVEHNAKKMFKLLHE